MTDTTYTLRGLSRQLGLDSRYIARALSGITADEIHGTRQRWALSTAKAAIARHGHNLTGSHYNDGGNGHADSEGNRALDALERIATNLQGALTALKSEKSIAKRRTRAKAIGPLLVAFQEALNASAAALPPNLRELTRAARAELLGEALAEVGAVLDIDLQRVA